MTYFLDQPGNSITLFPSTKRKEDFPTGFWIIAEMNLANEQSLNFEAYIQLSEVKAT